MRHALLLALAALAAAPLPAQRAAPDTARGAEIRTTGVATRSIRPDLAIVTLSFTATGRTPAAAGRAVAARADSLRQAIVRAGIPLDSLVTRSASWYWWGQRVEPVALPPRLVHPGGQTATGFRNTEYAHDTVYRANDAIEVRIRDLARIGAVIDAALALRVTDIRPVEFRLTRRTAVEAELLQEATRHAQRQAELIAEASGSRLGRAILLSTTPVDDWRSRWGEVELIGARVAGASSDAASYEGAPTVVAPPMVTVRVTVHGRWELAR